MLSQELYGIESDSTMNKTFSLHVDNSGLIPTIQYGPLSVPGVIPEYLWVWHTHMQRKSCELMLKGENLAKIEP